MNKKQWVGLLMIYISYLFLGATIFYYIEIKAENDARETQFEDYQRITKDIKEKFEEEEGAVFAARLSGYCGKTFEFEKEMDEVVPALWTFYNSFFFVVTVVSTIGYGNLHPTTDPGRLGMILYAIIGIPLNGILLSSLGQFFGAVFHRAHKRYKSHGRYGARCTLAVNVLTYLTPGLIVFIFLPAGLFCVFEDWDYIEAVYFAFVTLTTIGFGDLVAGQQDTREAGAGLWAYKILLVCWVIFGLGYLIMLLGFVAQAMQAKKIVQLEEKLLASVTHSRIWHGFAKDLGYMRRLMNELYLDKLKPVFRDEKEPPPQIIHRSKSLPDITSGIEDEEDIHRLPRRERAMSEHAPNKITLTRVFSETDLQRIDRNATFAAATTVPTTFELMRRVIDVYTGAQMREWPSEEDTDGDGDGARGVEGFSDEEVLSSEAWYDHHPTLVKPPSRHPSSIFNVPSYEDTVSRQPHRGRAMSECPQPPSNPAGPVDWTWSGPNANKLHDIIKQRNKQRMLMGLNKGRKGSLTSSVIAGAKKINPLRNRRRCVTENNSQEANINSSNSNLPKHKQTISVPANLGRKRRSLQENGEAWEKRRETNYMTTTAAVGRPDLTHDLHKLYSHGDNLFKTDAQQRELLEGTSLADFLRVLTNLHSRVGERLVTVEHQPKPRRKMGTASLTPPRIRSLLELFPAPTAPGTPRSGKKRKTSKITNPFRTDSRIDSTLNLPTTEDSANMEKPPEHSNLKRLGRFLLRSYSIVSKDAEEIPKPTFRRKRFSLWPTDSDDKDNPPFQLQVDSPSGGSKVSLDVAITVDVNESRKISSPSTEAPGLLFPPGHSSSNTTNTEIPKLRSPAPSRKNSSSQWVFINVPESEPTGDSKEKPG